jgi:biopolymer transport protein ExbD
MAEITANSQKKWGNFSKFHNRRSTRVDLTPMVDLGFLLITFFVFTTSMAEPKAMDLMEVKGDNPKDVKASFTMTIILSKNHEIYYYQGQLDSKNAATQVKKTDFHSIRALIVEKKHKSDPDFLMYIIKADKSSTFGDNINLLDEMAICNIESGHYAEVDITKEEIEIIDSKN